MFEFALHILQPSSETHPVNRKIDSRISLSRIQTNLLVFVTNIAMVMVGFLAASTLAEFFPLR